ncbi:WhiB family redox-sensing transcriptional regulator [Catenulispora sp. MAP12-49]|uniref:WhiB family transcriptional regulator n=1 Tax=unclassified Catenulispora TaxID=414885 RepID=UPI0035125D11
MRDHLPPPRAEHWDWQYRAACRGMDEAAFFSPVNERGDARRRREERARQVCLGCPVREPCAAFALTTQQHYGVWGGMTERDRRS